MLKVRFLEVSREGGRQLGVNWFVGQNGRGVTTGAQTPQIGQAPGSGPPGGGGGIPLFQAISSLAATSSGPFGVAIANLVNGGTTVDLMVNALESKGLVRRLAEPDLVALSGDTASFLAGGEFPVPVAQTTSGAGVPLITVQYKPFGVELTFMPTVLANGVINLRLAPSVSELDFVNAVRISGFQIPSLTKRQAKTTIELRDGQSFAIAGLLQKTNRGDVSQLPWIGSVPVLGALFRSTGYVQNETDLVIIVTPHLVRPAAPGQQMASPLDATLPGNDVDVFLMGQLERKKRLATTWPREATFRDRTATSSKSGRVRAVALRKGDIVMLKASYRATSFAAQAMVICCLALPLGRSFRAVLRAQGRRHRRRRQCEGGQFRDAHHRSVAAQCRQYPDPG